MKCIFCDLINGGLDEDKFIYKDKDFVVINDINPKAPVHVLIIPKNHYATLNDMREEDNVVLAKIFKTIPELAKKLNVQDGYKLLINQGEKGGQEVPHLHIHLLGRFYDF